LADWLEDGLSLLSLEDTTPIVVTKTMLRAVHRDGQGRPLSASLARGALMDALFRQYVTIGQITDPMEDGLNALEVDPSRAEIVRFVRNLDSPALAELRAELETQSAIMTSRWPRLSPTWMPRTQERVAVPLAGGRVVLVGVIDLVVGSPSSGRASVGLVEVKSGHPRVEDRDELRFYALLETLRSGAAPFRVATFYTRTGQVDAEDVTDELLAACVTHVLVALRSHLVCR
jgi:hypothetical protein